MRFYAGPYEGGLAENVAEHLAATLRHRHVPSLEGIGGRQVQAERPSTGVMQA